MIKHKLFAKGELIQALITTTQQPNVLIPVRAMIYDIKFDDANPQYQIRVKKFYDNISFLKANLFGGRFYKDFENHDTKINLKRYNYSTVEIVEDEVFNGQHWKSYLIVVDSVFCTKTRGEQVELFNNIQTFMIQQKLKELYDLTNRTVYSSGEFYIHTRGEYIKALQRFLLDKYPKDPNWVDEVLYRPSSSELDGAEWL